MIKLLTTAALATALTGCCCATGPLDTAGDDPRLDLQPAASTTASDAAAPAWAQDHLKIAPQSPDSERIFADLALAKPVTALASDFVVCRATSTADTDGGHPPDLTLQATFGSRTATIPGPEDTGTITFSVPIVTMAVGDPIKITAMDRDPKGTEPAGALEGTFEAIPFTLEGDKLTATCRTLERIEVERDMILAWRRFEATARELPASIQLNPKAPGWGRGDTLLDELRQDLVAMAALVGWSDSRVQTKLKQLADAEANWDKTVAEAIGGFIKTEAPTSKVNLPDESLTIEVKARACAGDDKLTVYRNAAPEALKPQADAASCLIGVEITNTGLRPLTGLGAMGRLGDLTGILAIGPKGRAIPTLFFPVLDGGKSADLTLNPDATQFVVLVPKTDAGQINLLKIKSRKGLVWASVGN